MLNATQCTWACDTCGEIIRTPKDGYLQWVVFTDDQGQRRGRDISIVHHKSTSPRMGGCYLDERGGCLQDLELDFYVTPSGLMQLLYMLHDGLLPKDDVIEVIKRLHIDGYEHARFHFNAALSAGVFSPNTAPGFYHADQIEAVLEWCRRRRAGSGAHDQDITNCPHCP